MMRLLIPDHVASFFQQYHIRLLQQITLMDDWLKVMLFLQEKTTPNSKACLDREAAWTSFFLIEEKILHLFEVIYFLNERLVEKKIMQSIYYISWYQAHRLLLNKIDSVVENLKICKQQLALELRMQEGYAKCSQDRGTYLDQHL